MSVWRFLDIHFPQDQICPFWLWDQLIAATEAELWQWRVFRGHFLSHLEPYLGRQLLTFTMLRDPVERTISHYYHVRRAPEHPFHRHAIHCSLAEFCLNSETRFMVENYQSAWLAKAPYDSVSIQKKLSRVGASGSHLQEWMHQPDKFQDQNTLLDAAEQRLLSFCAVGFAEHFEDSLEKIGTALGLSKLRTQIHENSNPERLTRGDFDNSTIQIIRELTQVDQQLISRAKARATAGPAAASPPGIRWTFY